MNGLRNGSPRRARASAGFRNRAGAMHKKQLAILTAVVACLLLAVSLVSLKSCSDNEPANRQAFIAFLNEKILPLKGVGLPELAAAEKKAFGVYEGHYKLLTDFQKTLANEAGKNATELLALTGFENLEALAKEERSLKNASREAEKLRALVLSLKEKADKDKAKLSLPEDLAPVYTAAYDKVVTLPADAAAKTFASVHSVFAAILDLLDFIGSHSRDMEIDGRNINLKNVALKDDLSAKMAAVREKAEELQSAYAEMTRTMLQ